MPGKVGFLLRLAVRAAYGPVRKGIVDRRDGRVQSVQRLVGEAAAVGSEPACLWRSGPQLFAVA